MRSFSHRAWGIAALAALAAISACDTGSKKAREVSTAQPAPVTKTAPPTPIQKKRIELGGPTWDPQWDAIIEKSLPPQMLSSRVPRDVRDFCPRFYQMNEVNKREFWAYFFQALAAAEAGLNATANVQHTEPEVAVRDAVTGRMVRSEGLLQLTYEDHKRYGCDFNWQVDRKLSRNNPEKTILQPVENLQCGIRILDTQIIRHHKPILSPTGYWSTLHPGTPDFAVFIKQMTNPPAACGRRSLHHRTRLPRRELARAHPAGNAVSSASQQK